MNTSYFRTRLAENSEMNTIYRMGFDVWGEGQSLENYLDSCRMSPKYARGTWYVLEDGEGKLVSSLITYTIDLVGEKSAIGIGSIATAPEERRKGLAGQLLREVMSLFRDRNGTQMFYLWADINPRYYAQCDFVALPEKFQTRPGSTIMMKCSKKIQDALLGDLTFKPPGYF